VHPARPARRRSANLVGKPVEAVDGLAQADGELHTALADLEAQLAKGNPGEVRSHALACSNNATAPWA
jgi:hypothetical protein